MKQIQIRAAKPRSTLTNDMGDKHSMYVSPAMKGHGEIRPLSKEGSDKRMILKLKQLVLIIASVVLTAGSQISAAEPNKPEASERVLPEALPITPKMTKIDCYFSGAGDIADTTLHLKNTLSSTIQKGVKVLWIGELGDHQIEDIIKLKKALAPDELLTKAIRAVNLASPCTAFAFADEYILLKLKKYGYRASSWRVNKHPRVMADVNNDGRADVVGFGNAGTYIDTSYSTAHGLKKFGYNSGWRVDKHPRVMADVNNDGRDDVVGFGHRGIDVSLSSTTKPSPGDRFFVPSYIISAPKRWINSYGYSKSWRVDKHPRFMADVNRDGRADVVGFGNAGAYVSLSNGSSFSVRKLWVRNYGYRAGSWRVDRHLRVMADVNGDGRADVVGFGNPGTYVSLSNGSRFSTPKLWVRNYGYRADSWRVDRHPRVMADVNGDGRADVVGFGNVGTYVSLSNGSRFTTPKLWVKSSYGYNQGWRVDKHPRIMADVNGDGRADVVGFGNAGAYVSLSDGSSFSVPKLWVRNYGYLAGSWRVDRHPRYMADWNGDGRADVVGFGNAGTFVSLSNGVDGFE